jgi:DNA-binding response OmpR family regulator
VSPGAQREVRAASGDPEKRILVADDDPYMRDLLVAVFRRAGYDVVSVGSGREVIARMNDASAPRPDVIISDVVMPDEGGFSVLRELERFDSPPAVILITAFGDPLTHRRGLEHGATHVMDKPFDLGVMLALVERLLA